MAETLTPEQLFALLFEEGTGSLPDDIGVLVVENRLITVCPGKLPLNMSKETINLDFLGFSIHVACELGLPLPIPKKRSCDYFSWIPIDKVK